jgi:nucleotide-binding universal stress UspA family protein
MSPPLRVLIAFDGSDTAFAVARCWAGWQGGEQHPLAATLLAAVPPPPHPFPPPGFAPGQVEQALAQWGTQRLEPAQALFATTALEWQALVRIGAPAAVIIDEAVRGGAELIALGTRGDNPVRGLMVGSVALRVAQTSRVPVWLMGPQARHPSALGRRMRLLVAVDSSEASLRAAAWAGSIASKFGEATIDLLSVQPAFSPLEGLLDAAAQRFDHWSQRLGEAAIAAARQALVATAARVDAAVRTGDSVVEICRRADEVDADAIVIGPRGLGAIGQALLGSVSSGLLQTASRPVIVVPEGS